MVVKVSEMLAESDVEPNLVADCHVIGFLAMTKVRPRFTPPLRLTALGFHDHFEAQNR